MLLDSHPYEAQDRSTVLAGMWSCTHHLETPAKYILQDRPTGSPRNKDKVYQSLDAHTDAIRLWSTWERLGWCVEDRQVRSLTIYDAEKIYADDMINFPRIESRVADFLVYLAFFKAYFPLLDELSLLGNAHLGRETFAERYLIVGNEVSDWYTRQRKWTLPELHFTKDCTDLQPQHEQSKQSL